jgi:hypothetical protein
MQSTPLYLSNSIMPIYRTALVFAFMLGLTSVLTAIGYTIFTYITGDLSFSAAIYHGFVVFFKGALITASISFIGFIAIWKKHQIKYNNCKYSRGTNCENIGKFNFV